MLQSALEILYQQKNLSEDQMARSMEYIMDGNGTPSQIGAFLAALKIKGETVAEITGGARVMRKMALPVELDGLYAIDTCGTGGDGSLSFNISTAVAFVAAAAGVPVVKHGNRSVSSQCGSADVLEQLGVNIALNPLDVAQSVRRIGIGFMFAPGYHGAMKHVAQSRKELAVRTIFNLLGPLTNPAQVKGQVLGVFALELTELMAGVLRRLGSERAMVVHGLDGLDEITLTTKTQVSELKSGEITTYLLDPTVYGFRSVSAEEFRGGDVNENAAIIRDVLQGARGAKRDIVVINAAAAIYVGKQAASLEQGIEQAKQMLDQGLALRKLEQLIQFSQECQTT